MTLAIDKPQSKNTQRLASVLHKENHGFRSVFPLLVRPWGVCVHGGVRVYTKACKVPHSSSILFCHTTTTRKHDKHHGLQKQKGRSYIGVVKQSCFLVVLLYVCACVCRLFGASKLFIISLVSVCVFVCVCILFVVQHFGCNLLTRRTQRLGVVCCRANHWYQHYAAAVQGLVVVVVVVVILGEVRDKTRRF